METRLAIQLTKGVVYQTLGSMEGTREKYEPVMDVDVCLPRRGDLEIAIAWSDIGSSIFRGSLNKPAFNIEESI